MQDFFQFYEYGGFFMNVISLMALAGLATLVSHAVSNRGAVGETRRLDLVDRLGGLTVAAGVLGSAFGGIELGWALSTVKKRRGLLDLQHQGRLDLGRRSPREDSTELGPAAAREADSLRGDRPAAGRMEPQHRLRVEVERGERERLPGQPADEFAVDAAPRGAARDREPPGGRPNPKGEGCPYRDRPVGSRWPLAHWRTGRPVLGRVRPIRGVSPADREHGHRWWAMPGGAAQLGELVSAVRVGPAVGAPAQRGAGQAVRWSRRGRRRVRHRRSSGGARMRPIMQPPQIMVVRRLRTWRRTGWCRAFPGAGLGPFPPIAAWRCGTVVWSRPLRRECRAAC
jgi:hypothetical protein